MPTGEDIVQFYRLYIRSSYTTGVSGSLSYDTMAASVKILVKGLMHHFPYFSLSDHYASRIEGVFETALQDGMMNRGLDRDRTPAGAVVVRRLLKALYEKPAAITGRKKWDSRFNDILMLVLAACLGARRGDIMGGESTKDPRTDLPGLRYNDITLAVDSNGVQGITGVMRMRNNKGQKLDASMYNDVFLSALPDEEDNIMCPIKSIIIQALRTGNLKGPTAQDVIQDAMNDPTHLIKWKFPDRPVLFTVGTAGLSNVGELANSIRLYFVLKEAVEAIGNKDLPITPHALRYGFATDLTMVDPKLLFSGGCTNDQISDMLSHSRKTRLNDGVNIYTGSFTRADTWRQRVKLQPDQFRMSPFVIATNPEVLQALKTSSGNVSSLKRAHVQIDSVDTQVSPVSSKKRTKSESIQFGTSFEPIVIFDDEELAEHGTSELDAPELDASELDAPELNASELAALSTVLVGDPLAFIDYFVAQGKQISEFICPNAKFGCAYKGIDNWGIRQHYLKCKKDSLSSFANVKPKKHTDAPKEKFKCPDPECDKEYTSKMRCDDHMRGLHTPFKCWVLGCVDTTVYIGTKALAVHMSKQHPAKGRPHLKIADASTAKFTCGVNSCQEMFDVRGPNRDFKPTKFHNHLLETHGITDRSERDSKFPVWQGNPCFYPGCGADTRFPNSTEGALKYSEHLSRDHHVTDEDEQFEYSFKRVRGRALPLEPKASQAEKTRPKSIQSMDQPKSSQPKSSQSKGKAPKVQAQLLNFGFTKSTK
jgi:hypothetical protein